MMGQLVVGVGVCIAQLGVPCLENLYLVHLLLHQRKNLQELCFYGRGVYTYLGGTAQSNCQDSSVRTILSVWTLCDGLMMLSV